MNLKPETTSPPWFLLQHPSPLLIEQLLQRERQGAFRQDGQESLTPVQYFIPYLFLAKYQATSQEDAEAIRQVRNVLHSYVFIQAPAERVQQLVDSEWNRSGVSQLSYKRSYGGEPLQISDDELQRFIATLKNSQLRYYVGQPLGDFVVGDSVTLHIEPWEGYHATISNIVLRNGRACLTVRMELFGSIIPITFPDVKEGEVSIDDPGREKLLSGNLISNFEEEVIQVLGNGRDTAPLQRIYAYRDIQVDNPDDLQRFTALMLICAQLLGDHEARNAYIKRLGKWLPETNVPRTDTEAYMLTALFVASRNPVLRDYVKAYLRATPNHSEVLHRLFAKAKRLRCR